MKKIFVLCLVVMMTLCLSGISIADEGSGIIDLRESELFTREDLESAADAILAEFSTWEGCELHLLQYAGDDQSEYELQSVNSLDKGIYDECAMFISAFRSPKEAYGAWEADKEYVWTWSAARADKGEWTPANWGWPEDFLKSDLYTPVELDAGAAAIRAELDGMEGVRLHFLRYAGDDISSAELEYVNSLERGTYDECAVYEVWFQSPKEAYGAWEADQLYIWTFYLARADKGVWEIVTFGN